MPAPAVSDLAGTVTFNGTPTATGTVHFTVNATDSVGGTLTKSYTITVNPVLVLTPSSMPAGDAGILYGSVITANNGTTPYTLLNVTGYNDGGTGLAAPTVNLGAGTVTFNSIPTATGVVTFNVNATDTAGGTLTKNYTVTVNATPNIAPASLAVGDVGVVYSEAITVSNGTTPYSVRNDTSFASAGTGLAAPTLNAAAGTVTFNSTPTAPGTITFTVNATDMVGAVLSKNYTITINPALTIAPAALPGGDVGIVYNKVITVSNGTTPYTVLNISAYIDGGTGLAAPIVNAGAGTVAFNSTPTASGTVSFTVTATDTAGGGLAKNYTIAVSPALTIAPASMVGSDVGVLYNAVLIVSNGTTPYTVLTVTGFNAGATGLTAPTASAAAGTVTFNSIPLAAGTVSFTVNATDEAGGTLTRNYTITVNQALSFAPATLPVGDAGVLYNKVITVSNGTTPYAVLSVTNYSGGGSGLAAPTVNAALGTVVFNSTPTAAGTVTFTVNATDAAGGTLTKNYAIAVNPALAMEPAAMPDDDIGILYNQVITVSSGTPPYTSLTVIGYNAGGTGLAAPTVNLGAGTVTFDGTPTATGTVTFTVTVTDQAGGVLTHNYALRVVPPMTITPAAMPVGDVGVLYNALVTVGNGTAPYTLLTVTSFNAGATGLTAPTVDAATGTVTFIGVPTGSGAVTFTVNAIDTAGSTLIKNYTITINPALTIAPAAIPPAEVGLLENNVITVSNGTTPYTALTVTGYNAGGTTLAAPTVNLAAGTVTINGTPTAAGTVTFTVRATDAAGGTLTNNYSITVYPALAVNPTSLPAAAFGTAYNQTLSINNPVTNLTVTNFSCRARRTGLTAPVANVAGGAVVVSGVPTGVGSASFTVTAVDAAGGTVTKNYSLTVNQSAVVVVAAIQTATFRASNQVLTLSASVVSAAGPVNEGTVTFKIMNGAIPIGLAVTSPALSGGVAKAAYTLPGNTPVGSYTIAATYNPGPLFLTNSDMTHTLTVNGVITTVTASNASVTLQCRDLTAFCSPAPR